MSLSLTDLANWLQTNIAGSTAVINRVPLEPDAVLVCSVPPGAGTDLQFEGAFIGTKVHVRARATTDAAAETLIQSVHSLVISQSQSFNMGGTRVLYCEPIGQPGYLERDQDDRSLYLGEYEFMVGT